MSSSDGKKKKGTISEEDVVQLLQRYSASTIIALLQEVYQFSCIQSDCAKIDWNALVKNTSTGICNAREYQMLWRYLAYQNPLVEDIEEEAELLDDDSDLEFEVEAVPAPTSEELEEAEKYVKVLLTAGPPDSGSASCSAIEASLPKNIPNDQASCSTIEASLPTNTPNDQASLVVTDKLASSSSGTSIAVLVSGQKQPLSTGPSFEVLDGNGLGSSSLPAKKKRQLWTKEEDMELIAAVQKCGEGNWASILKGDFSHNRTASQLSQRWAIIRKRQDNSNPSSCHRTGSSAWSEERLAAQKAFSLAVDMPMTRSISATFSGAAQATNSFTSPAAVSEASQASASRSLNQCQDKGDSNPLNKPRTISKKPSAPVKPSVGPDPLVQAAAFAAGARIASPSTAASLFKAAQSKNAVFIRPGGGGSRPISSALATRSSYISNPLRPQSMPNIRPVRPLPSSFGTTLSSSGPVHPATLPSSDCTMAVNPSTQPALSESNLEIVLGAGSQETAERDGTGSNVSAVDVSGLLSTEVGAADEMILDDVVAQMGRMDQSAPPVNQVKTVVEKDGQLEKEVSENQAEMSDAVGGQFTVIESREGGGTEDVSPGNQYADEGQLSFVEAADCEVEPSLKDTATASSKSGGGNDQLGRVQATADEVKESNLQNISVQVTADEVKELNSECAGTDTEQLSSVDAVAHEVKEPSSETS